MLSFAFWRMILEWLEGAPSTPLIPILCHRSPRKPPRPFYSEQPQVTKTQALFPGVTSITQPPYLENWVHRLLVPSQRHNQAKDPEKDLLLSQSSISRNNKTEEDVSKGTCMFCEGA